jgi:hypothetical protein
MLHKDPELIDPKTFEMIQRLQKIPELANFYLVGGTSLTLQMGHRNSIDIDLFTQDAFDNATIIEIVKEYVNFTPIHNFRNTIIGVTDVIKVDFIRHNYPFVLPPICEEGITFLSKEDITAMKLNAIVNSGKRLKDFIDIYYLLEYFSMNEMLHFFQKKYPDYNPMIAFKAINYFEDIDLAIDPPILKNPISIDMIKKRINTAVLKMNKRF